MKMYTRGGYVLGHRCGRGHSGNRRYALASSLWAECQGCGNFRDAMSLAFPSRAAALAAEKVVSRPTWPEDSAEAVLADRFGGSGRSS